VKKFRKCPKCGKSLSYSDHLNLKEAQSRIARFIDYNKDKTFTRWHFCHYFSFYNDWRFIVKLRKEIKHTSHHVWISNEGDGDESGHEIRQKTRRILWDYSKRKFRQDNSHINLDKYGPPHEVKGIIKKIIIKLFKK